MISKTTLANIGLVAALGVFLAVGITIATKGVPVAEATYQAPQLDDYLYNPSTNSAIDWGKLREINPHTVGWIRVEGTPIDYPLVHAPREDPEFYLTHDFYGNANALGTPYVHANCTSLNDSVVWIFGHHCASGRLFSALSNFADTSFAQSHPIVLFTPDSTGGTITTHLETSAVRIVDAQTEAGVATDFASNTDVLRWYTAQYQQAEVQLEQAHLQDQINAFVTCSYTTFENERTVVFTCKKD